MNTKSISTDNLGMSRQKRLIAVPPYELEKVTAINDIMKFGVMSMPGLAVDGKVLSQGKLLSVEEIGKLLR